ncbi:adenylyltransferase/cytidyltransferase family protein, partial [Campylobacter jejuni]
MKIALFGGSFDPPHNGHNSVVLEALEKLDIDKLIIMPTYINPFKQ